MGLLAIDGLASGLQTTDLINQLMQVEAMPQALLKSKQSSTQSLISGLQGLNTRVVSLGTAAAKAADAASWDAWKATSSTTSATATTGTTAQPGSVTFSVDKVATTQMSLSAATPDDGSLVPTIPPAVTISKADGSLVTVQPTTGSLNDIAKAVNDAADAGIKATVVRVSGGPNPEYRLQFTGTATGSDGTFEVYAGTDASGTRIDTDQVRAAENATVTLWKGTGYEQSYTQASNTFTGLMTGVDVTVSKTTGPTDDPVTITVARDDAALTKLASDMVGSLGVVLMEIASRTATTTKTNTDGTTTVTGGLFTGDSAVRGIHQKLTSAVAMPVDGFSPSEVGIVIGKDGTFTFDAEKFGAALAADPAKVQSMMTQIAERVSAAATAISDPYEGSLSLKIKGQESMVKDMGTQIESWDRRLELRRAGLERTYSALEVTLSNLQSQGNWLAGQLAGLPSYSSRS